MSSATHTGDYCFGDPRLPDRFWAKIKIDEETGCWLWTAAKTGAGYAKMWTSEHGNCQAHRFARHHLVGDCMVKWGDRRSNDLTHHCGVNACVNPGHLGLKIDQADIEDEGMRILVCGSRGFTDRRRVEEYLQRFISSNVFLIHGGARGPDQIAADWAAARGFRVKVYKPQWSKYGKAAGPIRNQEMIDRGKPEICIAFWDGKSKGTLNMIDKCIASDIKTEIVLLDES